MCNIRIVLTDYIKFLPVRQDGQVLCVRAWRHRPQHLGEPLQGNAPEEGAPGTNLNAVRILTSWQDFVSQVICNNGMKDLTTGHKEVRDDTAGPGPAGHLHADKSSQRSVKLVSYSHKSKYNKYSYFAIF